MSALEQSLDDIIGDQKNNRRREHAGRRPALRRQPRPVSVRPFRTAHRQHTNRQFGRPTHGSGIPNQIYKAAEGRPMLRLRHIHPELNGMDLNDLFVTIAPVDFVKFDPRDEAVAYVCFQEHYSENNARAIAKFDGKKAMGNTLIVENATSLADRIAPTPRARRDVREEAPRAREAPRAKARAPKARKPRPAPKTAEDLDKELSAYMEATSAPVEEKSAAFAAQNNGEVSMD